MGRAFLRVALRCFHFLRSIPQMKLAQVERLVLYRNRTQKPFARDNAKARVQLLQLELRLDPYASDILLLIL